MQINCEMFITKNKKISALLTLVQQQLTRRSELFF